MISSKEIQKNHTYYVSILSSVAMLFCNLETCLIFTYDECYSTTMGLSLLYQHSIKCVHNIHTMTIGSVCKRCKTIPNIDPLVH